MKKNIITILKFAMFLGIGILLVYWSIHKLTPDQVEHCKQAFLHADLKIILMMVGVGFCSHLFRALRWNLMIKPLGYSPKLINSFSAVMIGYFANLAFRLGEVLKCTMLNRYEKVPMDKLIGTIIIERTFDTLCLLVIMVITVISQFKLLIGFFNETIYTPLLAKWNSISTNALIVVILVGIALLIAIIFLFKKLNREKKFIKIINLLQGVMEGVKSIYNMKQKGLFLIYTVGIWGCYTGLNYLCFFTIPETSGLNFGTALSCISFGSIGTIIAPGGLGAYHQIIIETLKLYSIDTVYGFAYSWISWGTQTAVVIFGGLLALIYLPWANKKTAAE